MLISIASLVHRRRVLAVAVLVLFALLAGTAVAASSDGHLHVGSATIATLDMVTVEWIIEALICLVGVLAFALAARPSRSRSVTRCETARSALPDGCHAPRRSPSVFALCRLQA